MEGRPRSAVEAAADELLALAGIVLGQQDLSAALCEVARASVRAIPTADGCSLMMLRDGRPASVAYDGDWAKGLDELQFVEREGPCLDCARTGNVFRVRDLTVETRWPAYVVRAAEGGARSLVSLPMSSEGRVVGALNLYSRTADAFDADAVSVGTVLAAHAGLASQVAAAFFGHRDLAEQLRQGMASRAVIEQAKGVLMGRDRLTADEAFDVLRVRSQRENRKLRDVARDVVAEARG